MSDGWTRAVLSRMTGREPISDPQILTPEKIAVCLKAAKIRRCHVSHKLCGHSKRQWFQNEPRTFLSLAFQSGDTSLESLGSLGICLQVARAGLVECCRRMEPIHT